MRIVNYTTADARTSALQTEATLNWEANEDEWTVPIGTFVSKVVDIAGQKVSFQGGPRWYVAGLTPPRTGGCGSTSRCCSRSKRSGIWMADPDHTIKRRMR